MALLASRGSIAQCAAGHDVYRVGADVSNGQLMASDMFEPIGDQPKPVSGMPIAPCAVCGQPWIKRGPNGGWLFVKVKEPLPEGSEAG